VLASKNGGSQGLIGNPQGFNIRKTEPETRAHRESDVRAVPQDEPWQRGYKLLLGIELKRTGMIHRSKAPPE
jgi:hypothetical protein